MALARATLSEPDRRFIIGCSGGCCSKCKMQVFRENEFAEKARFGGVARYGVGPLSALNVQGQDVRLFLTIGLVGGFTTFSAFSLDAVAPWKRGQHAAAIGYDLFSVVGSLAASTVALLMVRRGF